MTYSETKGEKPFDWNDFLDRAIKGEFEKGESGRAAMLANDWTTCIVGNACDVIYRHEGGEPEDYELSELARRFDQEVFHSEWTEARITLAEIEARAEVVIDEMKEQKQGGVE